MVSELTVPNELITKISQDRCICFVGAGLSIGAGLPDWSNTMRQMVAWCKSHNIELTDENEINDLIADNDFLVLADTLIERMGDGRFRQFIAETFRGKKLRPTETHKLLPQIPFAAVLTSNYDKLIEGAYASANDGELPLTFTHLDTGELSGALQTNEFHILKTHGTVDRIESVILSGRQYRALLNNNNAYKIYLQQILTQKTVLFLGFSLTDPDLLSVLTALRFDFKDDTAPHYALVDATKTNSIKIERFRKDYNIHVIPYTPSDKTHPEVPAFLQKIIRQTPKKFLVNLEKSREELENLDSHYKIVGTTDKQFYIYEKYPGASKDKPLTHRVKLKFDKNTEEGRAALKAWQNLMDTGEETVIPPEFVESVELPEILKKFGIELANITITAGTYRSGEKYNVRFITTNEAGETATIENIQLECVNSGEKQIELNNESQNHFLKAKMIIPKKEHRGIETSFHCNYAEMNVAQVLTSTRFFSVLSKGGTVQIEFSDTGMPFGKATNIPPGSVPALEPIWIDIFEALLLIQQKTGIVFSNPTYVKNEEVKTILDTAFMLKTGRGEGTLTIDCDLNKEAANKLLKGENLSLKASHYAEYIPVILGEKLFLGPVWITSDDPVLIPEEEDKLRKMLAEEPDQTLYTVGLRSSTENPAAVYYLNFLSSEEFEKLHEDKHFREFTLGYLVDMLFSAAGDGKEELDVDLLISLFESAKNQLTEDGRSLNMLGRCSSQELSVAIEPHLANLTISSKGKFLGNLVELNLLSKEDFSRLLNK